MAPQSLQCSESTESLHAHHNTPVLAELRSAELLGEHVSTLPSSGHVLNRDIATLVAVTHKLELHINELGATTLTCGILRDKCPVTNLTPNIGTLKNKTQGPNRWVHAQ